MRMNEGSTMMKDMEEMMGHGHAAGYHEVADVAEGLAFSMKTEPSFPKAGEAATMTFFVEMRPGNTPYDDLIIEHEKYLHVIGLRDDLGQFFHIHPQKIDAGLWEAPYVFKEPGMYKVYVDVADASGNHSFGQKKFTVTAGEGEFAKINSPKIEFMKNVIEGNYQVALEHDEPLVTGRESVVRLTVHDTSGRGVELENFLGVPMHLAVISQDLTQYLHTHPADEAAHEGGVIDESQPHTHSFLPTKTALAHVETGGPQIESEPAAFLVPFEKAGIYRMFAQFRPRVANLPADEALTAEFFVKVETDTGQKVIKLPAIEHEHDDVSSLSPMAQKVILVVISIILMALLSKFVYKKIQV